MSVTSILAIGMVLVIVAGQIDLSVGALAGLLGAVVGHGLHEPRLAARRRVRAGARRWAPSSGCLQGTLVALAAIPPFIVTLGGMLVFQGALLGVTGGVSTSPPGRTSTSARPTCPARAGLDPGRRWWPRAFLWSAVRAPRRRAPGSGRLRGPGPGVTAVMNAYEGIPLPVLLVVAAGRVLLRRVASHTRFGRHLYAIGGNREAAFYSGIAIERHIVGVFTLMGAACAAWPASSSPRAWARPRRTPAA